MNDIEEIFSSFLKETSAIPAQRIPTNTFMNTYEEKVLQESVNDELDDFLETQAVERAFVSLRSDKRYTRYTQDEIDKMYELVRRYIHIMGASYKPSKTHFRIDDMSSRSIEVRFSQRSDVSLNLYVSEAGESDYEETYISYQEGNESIITNDTLDRMVVLVKHLIGE